MDYCGHQVTHAADVPLQTFDELLRGIGNDGSRAHTMTLPCTATAAVRASR